MLNFKPQYPKSGCPRCDWLRRLTKNPEAKCLKCDETIPQEWRDQNKIPYEPYKEKNHADSE